MTGRLLSSEGKAAGSAATFGVGVATCDTAQGLAAVNRPDTELVIWRRALPLCLMNWIEHIDFADLPDIRILIQPQALRRALLPLLDASGMPPGDMRELLIADVDDLVWRFSKVAWTELVDVRLQRVSHDACWKFHRDCVEARLLTTYSGPATEWVQPIHAERALREQKLFKGPVEQLQNNDVAIFKGSSAGPGCGIVHRSPPIAGSGRTRLLLCLNKPSATSPKLWPRNLEQ